MKTATTLLLYLVLAVLLQQPFQSCCADDAEPKKEKESKKPAEELIVSTHHSISIAGKQIKYQATAGKLAMKSDDLKKRGRRATPDHLLLQRRARLFVGVVAFRDARPQTVEIPR